MKIISALFFISFFSLSSFAAMTISSVTNASNNVNLNPQEGLIEILAGVSGRKRCVGSPTTTIDTCASAIKRSACNFRTVCSSTQLQIRLSSDSHSGTIKILDPDNQVVFSETGYNSGSTRTINVPWSEICRAVAGDPGCGSDVTNFGTKNLRIGIDSTGDDTLDDSIQVKFGVNGIYDTADDESIHDSDAGVADFALFPGDKKAYVERMDIVNENLNVIGAAEIVALRGFFIPGDCSSAAAVLPSASSVQMDLRSSDKTIVDQRVPDLENGTTFVFMFGLQDKAGNIGLYNNLLGDCVEHSETVMPREVYGMLSESQSCFITTAAFGSPLHSKVKTFKKFRDEILNQFSVGQKLIEFYYEKSPPIAKVIAESETLRAFTRIILWPAWAFSAIVLYVGLTPVIVTVLMLTLGVIFFRIKKSRNRTSTTAIALALLFSLSALSQPSFAQDDFFSTEESAPLEPPYSGTENDEFSEADMEDLELEESSMGASSFDNSPSNPDKWKPYQRVPDEPRLEELSQRGLFKITKKGAYLYDVERSPQDNAASFKVGTATFPNLYNPVGNIYFDEIYGTDPKPMLLADYEWQFFQAFGKMGIKLGSGLMLASGNGRFEDLTEAKEKYSFFMFPNSLSLVYRLQLFHKQWLVPYGEAGVDYLAFVETRDDGDDIKFGGAPHFHLALGGAFLLDTLGRDLMADIDRQYGINHIWLTAEYRRLESMGGDFDFSDDIFNAGIMVEF